LDEPYVSSAIIARKMRLPLSTVQRRRAKLEKSVLKRSYSLNMSKFGLRIVRLHIKANGGMSDEIAKRIFQNYSNVLRATVEMDSIANIIAEAYVRNTSELYKMTEAIKRVPEVSDVQFSETVTEVGKRAINLNDYAILGERRSAPKERLAKKGTRLKN
jgi:DNA-binding Lrp family transcriptional regulator